MSEDKEMENGEVKPEEIRLAKILAKRHGGDYLDHLATSVMWGADAMVCRWARTCKETSVDAFF